MNFNTFSNAITALRQYLPNTPTINPTCKKIAITTFVLGTVGTLGLLLISCGGSTPLFPTKDLVVEPEFSNPLKESSIIQILNVDGFSKSILHSSDSNFKNYPISTSPESKSLPVLVRNSMNSNIKSIKISQNSILSNLEAYDQVRKSVSSNIDLIVSNLESIKSLNLRMSENELNIIDILEKGDSDFISEIINFSDKYNHLLARYNDFRKKNNDLRDKGISYSATLNETISKYLAFVQELINFQQQHKDFTIQIEEFTPRLINFPFNNIDFSTKDEGLKINLEKITHLCLNDSSESENLLAEAKELDSTFANLLSEFTELTAKFKEIVYETAIPNLALIEVKNESKTI